MPNCICLMNGLKCLTCVNSGTGCANSKPQPELGSRHHGLYRDPDNERHHPPQDVSVWCRCGNCRHMPSVAEQLCCKMQPRHCLSRRAELEMLVLDEGVLAVADQHRVDMLEGEVRLNNEGRRHVAYRQFVLWRHGRLGQGNRRVIPSCCVWAICDRYPKVDGHYRGYVYVSFFILAISSMVLCIFKLTTGEIRNSATITQIKAYWLLPSGVNRVEHSEINYINFTPMNEK